MTQTPIDAFFQYRSKLPCPDVAGRWRPLQMPASHTIPVLFHQTHGSFKFERSHNHGALMRPTLEQHGATQNSLLSSNLKPIMLTRLKLHLPRPSFVNEVSWDRHVMNSPALRAAPAEASLGYPPNFQWATGRA